MPIPNHSLNAIPFGDFSQIHSVISPIPLCPPPQITRLRFEIERLRFRRRAVSFSFRPPSFSDPPALRICSVQGTKNRRAGRPVTSYGGERTPVRGRTPAAKSHSTFPQKVTQMIRRLSTAVKMVISRCQEIYQQMSRNLTADVKKLYTNQSNNQKHSTNPPTKALNRQPRQKRGRWAKPLGIQPLNP